MKRQHVCWGCGSNVNTFTLVKRKVYKIKRWECVPACFCMIDIERINKRMIEVLSRPSPFLNMILEEPNNPKE